MQLLCSMREVSIFDHGQPRPEGFRDVSPAAAYEARDAVRLVDVREPSEFTGELGHVPGAELVPLGTIGLHLDRWDRDADIVLICQSGNRSGRAATALARAGFHRVMNLAGGMLAYTAAKLPVART